MEPNGLRDLREKLESLKGQGQMEFTRQSTGLETHREVIGEIFRGSPKSAWIQPTFQYFNHGYSKCCHLQSGSFSKPFAIKPQK
jgi:hypothetical protein